MGSNKAGQQGLKEKEKVEEWVKERVTKGELKGQKQLKKSPAWQARAGVKLRFCVVSKSHTACCSLNVYSACCQSEVVLSELHIMCLQRAQEISQQ